MPKAADGVGVGHPTGKAIRGVTGFFMIGIFALRAWYRPAVGISH